MCCLDNHSGPRPAPGTGGVGPAPGQGAGQVRVEGHQDPPYLLQQRLLRGCHLVVDGRQGRAAGREGHGRDTDWRYQWDQAEAGIRVQEGGRGQAPDGTQETARSGDARAGTGFRWPRVPGSPWDLVLGAQCWTLHLHQGSWGVASGTTQRACQQT